MLPLDQYALSRLNKLIEKCLKGYESFNFHAVTSALHNFCVVEMSNFYLDILKDTLYCDAKNSASRRSSQTTLHIILDVITRLIAPILPFTAEEIWSELPNVNSTAEMALFADMPTINPDWNIDESEYKILLTKRDEVNKALEDARTASKIGKSLEAQVTITVTAAEYEVMKKWQTSLPMIFIVSTVILTKADDSTIVVEQSPHEKCARCWMQVPTVGQNAQHPTLCIRCANVVDN